MEFSKQDLTNIKKAQEAGGKIWENDCLEELRKKIKEHYLKLGDEQCCYCKRSLKGEFGMVIDVEHILPKGKAEFKSLMFTLSNLNVACKRCNMNVKRTRVDFLTDTLSNVASDHENAGKYEIIHPNLDKYFEHLFRHELAINDVRLVKYSVVADSSKGKFSYDFFRLTEFEIDALNKAQGVGESPEWSSKIGSEMIDHFREIILKL